VKEVDYCYLLNKVLPSNIRALGWTEVTSGFSARFSAKSRTYRYFFTKKNRNILAMQQAAKYLLGEHDFRNLCKMDVVNVSNFVREIYSSEIKIFQSHSEDSMLSIWMLEITGIAFLWHMIRCIMSVLLMVGDNLETPEIIPYLLDIDKCKSKPHYDMAEELPLVLHNCNFENLHISYLPRTLWSLTDHFDEVMSNHLVAYARAKNAFDYLKCQYVRQKDMKELLDDLYEKKDRLLSRVHNNTIQNQSQKNNIQLNNSTSSTVQLLKRQKIDKSFDEVVDEDMDNLIVWSDALKEIERNHGFTPIENFTPHVPLQYVSSNIIFSLLLFILLLNQRKGIDDYSTRIQNLQGKKKVLFSYTLLFLH
jgi:tRNA pseudouridine(38-40) synthase